MKFDIAITKKTDFFYYQTLKPNLVILNDWKVVVVKGKDSKKYLQSKLTIDMDQLKLNKHYIAAHCSINGRVIALLRLFQFNGKYGYLIKKKAINSQVKELVKYSIFSKVSIDVKRNLKIIGLIGESSDDFLKNFFLNIPNEENPLVIENDIILFLINNTKKRYLLIFPHKKRNFLYQILVKDIIIKGFEYWNFLDIELGFPIIEKNVQEKFLPQELGLQRVFAINFFKGCYQGQEVISRAYFKKIKNNFLCWMISFKKNILKKNLKIEVKVKNKWISIGKIIYFTSIDNNFFWIQAILNKKIDKNYKFRVFFKKYEELFLKKVFYI
ncbi:tRNA-modifying protein YgfZ [Buchnera aphidicola (Mindarus keteleerifoliae)]|uniref:tRNA-modifying protein YgfZ n=1 Tax=Buchnera aphidicola TaxID=9 RepID=UPI0031B6E9CE